MTICWWIFGIRRSSIRLWKAEPLLYKNLPTKNYKLDVGRNYMILKTRGFLHDDVGQDAFHWMSNNINMPSGAETKTNIKQFKTKKTSLLWICNEKVLPNASLACIFDLDTSCSVESLSFMQLLDICGSIIWFVVIFIHFHFIMLQNKLFERWIATVAL